MLNFKQNFPNVGNGNAAVDTAAFKIAVGALPPSGDAILFPAGVYTFNERIDITEKRLRILGEGQGLTHFKWIAGASAGLRVSGSSMSGSKAGEDNRRAHFEIEGLSLTTDYVATGQAALSLVWNNGEGDPRRKTRIRDIEIRPWNKYNYSDYKADETANLGVWETGIKLQNPGGIDISHTDIYGNPGRGSKNGLWATTDPAAPATSIRHFLSNLYVYGFENGILWEGTAGAGVEGVYFNNFEIVWCGNGYTGTRIVGHHLSNGHMDCLWNGARFSDESVQVTLNNIDFHQNFGAEHFPLTPLPGNLVSFVRTFRFTVAHCHFLGFKDKPATPASNGIFVGNSAHGLIIGSHFDAMKVNDIVFGRGAHNCHAIANRLDKFVDQGQGTNSCDLRYWSDPPIPSEH